MESYQSIAPCVCVFWGGGWSAVSAGGFPVSSVRPPQSVSVCGPSAPPCPAPRRHVSSLLSFTASVTTSGSRVHGARPRPPPLCYFKRSSASWVLECLSRACLATYGVTVARKDYNTQSAPGAWQSIRLQHMGVGVRWGVDRLPAASGTGLTGTATPHVFVFYRT